MIAILVVICLIILIGVLVIWFSPYAKVVYPNSQQGAVAVGDTSRDIVYHLPTPKPLKAVYMSSWAAGNDKFRKHLFDLVDTTEINAVVIDIKDYTGRISFRVEDSFLNEIGSSENRISDIKDFISKLHEKKVYVIGRISCFQDSYLVKVRPDWAVKSQQGGVWADYKGVKWLDAGAKPVWDYLVAIGKQSYAYGFDELNFDYIRYPSDGDMTDVFYSWDDGFTRQEVMKSFFMYLRESFDGTNIPLSIDLFGLTTSASGDLGIGQSLIDALPYFDYVSPMVYPSHFAKGFLGFPKPATHPYEVIKSSMDSAISKANIASSSPEKIRPWLQAFDLGAVYTPAMVRAQIQATYDSGLDSWMLWNAASVYDKEGLISKEAVQGPTSDKI